MPPDPSRPSQFTRRDVWRLSKPQPWHPVIEWYARAIIELQSREGPSFADPTSWRHLAAIHGTDIAQSDRPAGARWDQCVHGSWFFLPWHRAYLHHFEKIVRATVRSLGGPKDWALPYWDYSDTKRTGVRRLPPAFREPRLRTGEANPLFVAERAPGMNEDAELPPDDVRTDDAFREVVFAEPGGDDAIAGFGGAAAPRAHSGQTPGALERTPHASVHGAIGGNDDPPGWMGSFASAGRDPIFWLHHANIDRLWAKWLRTAGHRNPDKAPWLREKFEFGGGDIRTSLSVHELLDTTAAPLNYTYDDEAGAIERVPGFDREAREGGAMRRRLSPERVGATESSVPLGTTPTVTELAVEEPRSPALEGIGSDERRVYLKIDNVQGDRLTASSFSVYVNAPSDASPQELERHRAGTMPMFGVIESSQGSETHSGGGLNFSFDITDLVRRLAAENDWQPDRLRVTFVPVPDSRGRVNAKGNVRVGQVSLYYA